MKTLIIFLVIILSLVSWSDFAVSRNESDSLFIIERNQNKNYVQYDVRLTQNNDVSAVNPVIAYWVLENGRQEDLTLIEKKYMASILKRNLSRTSSGSLWSLLKAARSLLKR